MKRLNILDWTALIILLVGGLNWGLIGIIGIDIVGFLFGWSILLVRIIFTVVGVAALYVAFMVPKLTKK